MRNIIRLVLLVCGVGFGACAVPADGSSPSDPGSIDDLGLSVTEIDAGWTPPDLGPSNRTLDDLAACRASCAGCCTQDGACNNSQDTSCGVGGAICQTCAAPATCSTAGQCETTITAPCNPTSCATGCCTDSNNCLILANPDVFTFNCNTAGNQCRACRNGTACDDQHACTDNIHPTRNGWTVRIAAIEVANAKLDGNPWDGLENNPELRLCMLGPASGVLGCAAVCPSGRSCANNYPEGALIVTNGISYAYFTSADLRAGLQVQVIDIDAFSDDIAGTGQIAPITSLSADDHYSVGAFGAVLRVDFEVYF